MGYLYKRGDIWWMKYYRNGRMYRESTKESREEAAKGVLKRTEGDIARGLAITPKIGRVTVEEILEGVTRDCALNRKKTGATSAATFRIICFRFLASKGRQPRQRLKLKSTFSRGKRKARPTGRLTGSLYTQTGVLSSYSRRNIVDETVYSHATRRQREDGVFRARAI